MAKGSKFKGKLVAPHIAAKFAAQDGTEEPGRDGGEMPTDVDDMLPEPLKGAKPKDAGKLKVDPEALREKLGLDPEQWERFMDVDDAPEVARKAGKEFKAKWEKLQMHEREWVAVTCWGQE